MLLDTLNKAQKEAVITTEGPLLVLAGAGTGKTRVLVSRIAHIILEGKAQPQEILGVTFTNKAAKEMQERVLSLLPFPAPGLWLGTFHSMGVRILRMFGEHINIAPQFQILGVDDQKSVLKQIIKSEGIRTYPVDTLLSTINALKDKAIRVETLDEHTLNLGHDADLMKHVFRQYQKRLAVMNALDFNDLLLEPLHLFQTVPEVLNQYSARFRYILVDEYQDTNAVQYLWLRLLSQNHKNICCVGDDDQSIYSWRGAEIGNILRFEKDFPSAHVIRLEQNYRSTHHILGAASSLIHHNAERLGKTLWTNSNEGQKVFISKTWSGREEAFFIGQTIEQWQHRGVSLQSMAILVRAGFQTREFEEQFLHMAIPYTIVGGLRFYERKEIRDALAYLRLLIFPNDDLAFERIINLPRRGIGEATLQKLHLYGREHGVSLITAAQYFVEQGGVPKKASSSLTLFLQSLSEWREALSSRSHQDVARLVLDDSGYLDMWKHDTSPDAQPRVDNLHELLIALSEFESLAHFFDHVSLVLDMDNKALNDAVNIMTIHSAKGLEFEHVFLAGWEEGIFPSQKSAITGIEEERRLAYVALTRARQSAYITFAGQRRVHGHWQMQYPSRFISEIDPQHMEWLSEKPYTTSSSVALGGRVFHQKFGHGIVQAVEEDQAIVSFDKAGTKRILTQYLQ